MSEPRTWTDDDTAEMRDVAALYTNGLWNAGLLAYCLDDELAASRQFVRRVAPKLPAMLAEIEARRAEVGRLKAALEAQATWEAAIGNLSDFDRLDIVLIARLERQGERAREMRRAALEGGGATDGPTLENIQYAKSWQQDLP